MILEPDYRWIRSDLDAGFFEPEQDPDMATSYVGAFNAWSLGLTVKPLLGRRDGKQIYPLVGAARTNFDYQEWRVDEDGRQQVEQILLRRLQGTAGFGVQHWVTDDLTLSVDMQVVSVGKVSQLDAEGVDDEDTTLNADGLSVDPSARLMLHLYW